MIELDRKERDELRQRYRDDKLFQAWSHPLNVISMELDMPAPEAIWLATEKIHLRLRKLGDNAPSEIDFIFSECVEDLQGGEGVTKGEALFTSAIISFVLMSQLCAAKPHMGQNPNKGCCKALARILTRDPFLAVTRELLGMLRNERVDLNDNKVIVPVINYLDEAEHEKMLSDATRKDIESMVEKILDKTAALKPKFSFDWTEYRNLWVQVLSEPGMLSRIKEVSPNKNEWNFNMKMVSNVLGIIHANNKIDSCIKGISTLIRLDSSRTYISNHADYSGSRGVFNEEEHKWIDGLVKNL